MQRNLRCEPARLTAAFIDRTFQCEKHVEKMTRYQVLLAPTREQESVGWVSPEGLAAGLLPLMSNCGCLSELAGHCGPSYECGNVLPPAKLLAFTMEHPEARRGPTVVASAERFVPYTHSQVLVNYERLLMEASGPLKHG